MGPRKLLKKLLPQRETSQPQSLRYPATNAPNSSPTTPTISTPPPEHKATVTLPQSQTLSASSNAVPGSSEVLPTAAEQPPNARNCDPLGHDNKSKLWEQAKDRISLEDYATIEKFITKEKGPLKFEATEIGDVIHSLQGKGRLCKEQNWTFPCGKYTLNLQKAVEKTLYWLEKIKAPVEIAVNADPIHAGLPWAAIKCLVLVVQAEKVQIESLISGLEKTFYVFKRFQLFEELLRIVSRSQLKDEALIKARHGLQGSLVEFYAFVLGFIAQAIRVYEQRRSRRFVTAIWSSDQIKDFQRQCQELETRTHREAEILHMLDSGIAHDQLTNVWELEKENSSMLSGIFKSLKDNERGEILEWISPIDAEQQQRSSIKGRVADTGAWILRHKKFLAWKSTSGPALFWLHGIPGAGKTKLVSTVIDSFNELYPESTLAYFYCSRDRDDAKGIKPEYVLRSYIKQLATSHHDDAIQYSIVERYRLRQSKGSKNVPLDLDECRSILPDLIGCYSEPVLILDALDEMGIDERRELMEAVDELLACCDTLKILISSRKNDDIKRRLEDSFELDVQSANNQEDIEKFIESEIVLIEKDWKNALESNLRKEIKTYLLEQNEGMFQWVSVHLARIRRQRMTDQGIRNMLKTLPKGLSESYDLILEEIQHSEGSSVYAKRAFQCVLHAFQPLMPQSLVEFVKRDPSTGKVDHEGLTIEMIFGACHNLLIVSGSGRCRFPHLSVREYFEQAPRGNMDIFPDSHSHAGLACISLEAFMDGDRLRPSRDRKMWESQSGLLISLLYTTNYWHRHAVQSLKHGSSNCLMKLIGDFFSDHCSEPFLSWLSSWLSALDQGHLVQTGTFSELIQVDEALYGKDNLHLLSAKLYCASLLGFDFLIQPLLGKGARIGAIGRKEIGKTDRTWVVKYENAIVAAAVYSHTNILQTLLRVTGSIKFRDILLIMRSVESPGSKLFHILQSVPMDVSERIGDAQAPVLKYRFPGDSFASHILAAAVGNEKSGPQLVQMLIDTYQSMTITKDVVLKAAANTESGDKIMLLLLDCHHSRYLVKKDVFIRKDVLDKILMIDQLAPKILDVVLMKCQPNLPLTKSLMALIMRAKFSSELIAILFKRNPNLSLSDEAVHLVAQGSDSSNPEIMSALVGHRGQELVTDDVFRTTAKSDQEHADRMMKCLLRVRGDGAIQEEILSLAAMNPSQGRKIMEAILETTGRNIEVSKGFIMAAIQRSTWKIWILDTLIKSHTINMSASLGEIAMEVLADPEIVTDVLKLLLDPSRFDVVIDEDILKVIEKNHKKQHFITTVMADSRARVCITETLLRCLSTHGRFAYTVLRKLSENMESITPGAFIAIFQDYSSAEALLVATRPGARIPFTEELVKTVAGSKHGPSFLKRLIGSDRIQLVVTEVSLTQVAAILDTETMKKLLQKHKSLQITEDVLRAAETNPLDAIGMRNLLECHKAA